MNSGDILNYVLSAAISVLLLLIVVVGLFFLRLVLVIGRLFRDLRIITRDIRVLRSGLKVGILSLLLDLIDKRKGGERNG